MLKTDYIEEFYLAVVGYLNDKIDGTKTVIRYQNVNMPSDVCEGELLTDIYIESDEPIGLDEYMGTDDNGISTYKGTRQIQLSIEHYSPKARYEIMNVLADLRNGQNNILHEQKIHYVDSDPVADTTRLWGKTYVVSVEAVVQFYIGVEYTEEQGVIDSGAITGVFSGLVNPTDLIIPDNPLTFDDPVLTWDVGEWAATSDEKTVEIEY